jgi:site-specific recombinase XerD
MSTTEKNLHEAINEYLAHLKDTGKRPSTISTAMRTLKLLEEQLGTDKQLDKLLTVHVSQFFTSEAATTLRGKPRAPASILQIRRIVRYALVWWQGQGYMASVPIPKEDKRFLEPKATAKDS